MRICLCPALGKQSKVTYIKAMKRLILIAALAASPAVAEDSQDVPNLIEEGAKMFLRGLMTEMEPAIDDLRTMMDELGPAVEEFALEMGPALAALLDRVDDLRHYQQPEFLPNGDIIIRRKPNAPLFEAPPVDQQNDAIEL